jgi:hypothetical protein
MLQRVFANIFDRVGLLRIIQGIMPLEIKGHLGNGLFIGEVKGLLEENGSEHGIELFGGTPHDRGRKRGITRSTGNSGRIFP